MSNLRDMQRVRALKQEGHDIIDSIVKLHWTKNTVYRLLAEKLECLPENAHFYNMHTERDCARAVQALHIIKADLIEQRAAKKRERDEKVRKANEARKLQEAAEYERLAEEQKRHVRRQNVWWRRLLRGIGL